MYQGECHCGNVRLSIPKLTATATSCTCSICSRYAAIWGYFKKSDVQVEVGEYGITSYCHGDKMIDFNHCTKCGCVTHYTSTGSDPEARLAVNYRMFPASSLQKITVKVFDGANTWQYLD